MRKLVLGLAACLCLSMGNFAAPQNRDFTGEIMDDACASEGGHESMRAKDETDEHCTRICIKTGSKFVLYNAETQATYSLDDQKKPDAFAGQKVIITGTLDEAKGTIHVVSIRAAK